MHNRERDDCPCHTKIQNVSANGSSNIAGTETHGAECSARTRGRDTRVFQSQRPTLVRIKNCKTLGKRFLV
jgi:hypothetical protein